MSNSFLSFYDSEQVSTQDRPFDALETRAALLERCENHPKFDLVVIGGGIDAVLIAHEGALAELRVLVIAPEGIGGSYVDGRNLLSDQSKTSGKPPAVGSSGDSPISIARAPARNSGPLRDAWHLFCAFPALISTMRAFPYPHLWRAESSPFVTTLDGLCGRLVYTALRRLQRALMGASAGSLNLDLNLLAREVALAARQEGACLLSGVKDVFLEAESQTGCYRLGFTDCVSGKAFEVLGGGVVLDPSVSVLPRTRLGTLVKCSKAPRRGVHEESGVFFLGANQPWDAVRNSRRVVSAVLKAGAPYGYAPQRVALRKARKLPGCAAPQQVERFRQDALEHGVTASVLERVVNRWAGRLRYLDGCVDAYREILPGVLQGEVEMAVYSDHSVTALEVGRNSLGLTAAELSEDALRIIDAAMARVQR